MNLWSSGTSGECVCVCGVLVRTKTDQSGDEGNPKVPQVLVEELAVDDVPKQSDGSWFAQSTRCLGFCKNESNSFLLTVQL